MIAAARRTYALRVVLCSPRAGRSGASRGARRRGQAGAASAPRFASSSMSATPWTCPARSARAAFPNTRSICTLPRTQAGAPRRRLRQDGAADHRHGAAGGAFSSGRRAPTRMQADLFIAIHHDSVPDNLMQTWEYDGQSTISTTTIPAMPFSSPTRTPHRAGSLLFGSLLGKELQARGLHYTPHYTLPLMGHRRRELVDAEAGVYRYDQLIVLRRRTCRRCCSKPDRSSTGRKNWNWRAPNAGRLSAPQSRPRSRISARRGASQPRRRPVRRSRRQL